MDQDLNIFLISASGLKIKDVISQLIDFYKKKKGEIQLQFPAGMSDIFKY